MNAIGRIQTHIFMPATRSHTCNGGHTVQPDYLMCTIWPATRMPHTHTHHPLSTTLPEYAESSASISPPHRSRRRRRRSFRCRSRRENIDTRCAKAPYKDSACGTYAPKIECTRSAETQTRSDAKSFSDSIMRDHVQHIFCAAVCCSLYCFVADQPARSFLYEKCIRTATTHKMCCFSVRLGVAFRACTQTHSLKHITS